VSGGGYFRNITVFFLALSWAECFRQLSGATCRALDCTGQDHGLLQRPLPPVTGGGACEAVVGVLLLHWVATSSSFRETAGGVEGWSERRKDVGKGGGG
jgi:hypothetical protein